MNIRKHIPNAITTLNLFFGLIAITLAMKHNLTGAGMMIMIAAIFDFLDGTAARILDARSEIGKQLDSLADVVSFGVAPGMIVFQLLSIHCEGGCSLLESLQILPYFALLIPVTAALRLAKFNIDPNQDVNFTGMPTPANALFFASIPLILDPGISSISLVPLDFLAGVLSIPRVLAMLAVIFAYLMVSDFRLFSLKFKNGSWNENQHRYLFLAVTLVLVVLFSVSSIPLILAAYLVISLLFQKLL